MRSSPNERALVEKKERAMDTGLGPGTTQDPGRIQLDPSRNRQDPGTTRQDPHTSRQDPRTIRQNPRESPDDWLGTNRPDPVAEAGKHDNKRRKKNKQRIAEDQESGIDVDLRRVIHVRVESSRVESSRVSICLFPQAA